MYSEYETFKVLVLDVANERKRQVEKWGVNDWPDGTGSMFDAVEMQIAKASHDRALFDGSMTWRHILSEEVAEVFAESDDDAIRRELIQVAAVAIQWVEAIDRRKVAG